MVNVLRKNSSSIAVVTDLNRVPFVLSDATPDAYGDVIEAKGWILDDYRNNPIVLANHDASFPCGKMKNVREHNNKLVGDLELAPAGTSGRIDEVRALVDADILTAVSVGFIPVKFKPLPSGGRHYTE